MECLHEITYKDDDVLGVVCEECYEILNGRCHERQFINEGHCKSSNQTHCTMKYFQKKMNILDIAFEYNEVWLMADFITQENALKETIFDKREKRMNSLNVKYKFHKLLQHQGIIDTGIPLLKTNHIRLEHDRIMKMVWNKLNWSWVD